MLDPLVLRRPAAIALAAAGLATAGALALHGSPADAAGSTLRVTADAHGQLRFNTRRLSAHAGRVTIVMSNPRSSGLQHGVAIDGRHLNRRGRIVNPGGTSSVTVTLKKGTYEFFCPVMGHKAAGMKGTLVVR